MLDLRRDIRLRYAMIFKNHGSAAGASLSHPHTQLIATPVTPLTMAEELVSAKVHYQVKERCLFCDVIQQELEAGERIVTLEDRFVALAPTDALGGKPFFNELTRAVKGLGFKGLHINCRPGGKHLDSRELWPFYEKVSELGIPIDVHISDDPSLADWCTL
jgi:hypothetical protein